MKLKSRPDDFQVEELTSVTPGASGAFAYYCLTKKSVGTPEAIQRVCKELRIDSRRVRYGGLKDRHAETKQYLTIEEGPPRHFRSDLIQLKYLGQVAEPYGPQSFFGNRFIITMRDLTEKDLESTLTAIQEVQGGLVGNYFDDQRFGSVGQEQQFVARALIEGDDETALKLATTTYYEHDRSVEKKGKVALKQQWGQWTKLIDKLPRGQLSQIVTHLHHRPGDFRGAFVCIPFFLRNMYLSAYQSHLWNRVLADWIKQSFPESNLVAVQQKYQKLPMPFQLTPGVKSKLLATVIPLPSSRTELPHDESIRSSLERVLKEENLKLSEIKLRQYREPFFSKGDRQAFYAPEDLKYESGWDKLNKGHRKLKLSFSLSRGSYATMLIKRISTASPWNAG